MINIIRSEWIKFRSVRSTIVTLFLAGALVVIVALISANQVQDNFPPITLTELTGGVSIAALIFGALGVQILGQEYRFNTIRPTFTAVPQRWKVLVAKLVVVTLACATISVLMVGFCYLIGTTLVDGFETDGVDQRVMFGIVLFSMGWSAMGMGIGAIVRQPIAGILIQLAEAFVIESIIAGIIPSAAKWMPFLNGFQMTFRTEGSDTDLQTVFGGGVYFFVVAAVIWIIGAVLATRRDA